MPPAGPCDGARRSLAVCRRGAHSNTHTRTLHARTHARTNACTRTHTHACTHTHTLHTHSTHPGLGALRARTGVGMHSNSRMSALLSTPAAHRRRCTLCQGPHACGPPAPQLTCCAHSSGSPGRLAASGWPPPAGTPEGVCRVEGHGWWAIGFWVAASCWDT